MMENNFPIRQHRAFKNVIDVNSDLGLNRDNYVDQFLYYIQINYKEHV